jgi:hypothetical protein
LGRQAVTRLSSLYESTGECASGFHGALKNGFTIGVPGYSTINDKVRSAASAVLSKDTISSVVGPKATTVMEDWLKSGQTLLDQSGSSLLEWAESLSSDVSLALSSGEVTEE